MTVHDLLEALLLESANDAAVTLAEGISGSREAFVDEMNERAARAGPRAHELREPDRPRRPRATTRRARDLATLARVLLRDRASPGSSTCPRRELESGARPRVVDNRNDLSASYPVRDRREDGPHADAGNVLVGAADAAAAARA